jgi:hypothetical protein
MKSGNRVRGSRKRDTRRFERSIARADDMDSGVAER